MDRTQNKPSLENKLLALHKGSLLTSQKDSRLLQSKRPLCSYEKPKTESAKLKSLTYDSRVLSSGLTSSNLPKDEKKLEFLSGASSATKNTLLASSISKEMTQNKLLHRPNLLSRREPPISKSGYKEMGKTNAAQLSNSDLGLKGLLKTNILLSCRYLSLDRNKTKSTLLKTDSLTTRTTMLAPATKIKSEMPNIIRSWEDKVANVDKYYTVEDDEVKVIIEEEQSSRPVYELEFYEESFSKELSGRTSEESDFRAKYRKEKDPEVEKKLKFLQQLKIDFLNVASTAMIQQPDFNSEYDECRMLLMKSVKALKRLDPEFVLKVALYLRKELNIKTGTNFILALAAKQEECRPYLKRYFNECVVLPSDWIDVAEFYQTLHGKNFNFGSLPVALRKVMISKFATFDNYQLAKYNKEKSRLKNDKKHKEHLQRRSLSYNSTSSSSSDSDSTSSSDSSDEIVIQRKSFTLKQLIRKLHIAAPVYPVMCLVGRKYPTTAEEFRTSRLEGLWDAEKAGKRMKLPTPETWETQVALKGNKASTWEQLLDHKKLPFMAMLRNLRNMLQAGISSKHHNMVIKKLSDEQSVIKSKQFPFRFFSAYDALNELECEYKEMETRAINGELLTPPIVSGRARGRGRGRGGRGRRGKTPQISQLSDMKYDSDLIKKYRKALDTALRISCVHNITPMPGCSILICDVGWDLDVQCFSVKSFGKTKTVLEISLLLGLMAKYSCEDCKLLLYNDGKHILCDIENQGTILTNLVSAKERVQKFRDERMGDNTEEFLLNLIKDRTKVDNLMYFGISPYVSPKPLEEFLQSKFIEKYRVFVNTEMLFVNVDLLGYKKSLGDSSDPRNITIGTYSDQILRFVAERGNSTLLSHVDNIDLAFNLRDIKIFGQKSSEANSEVSLSPNVELGTPWWRNVRVFISSTFRDMHGERDLLTRYVFPELRSRAMQHFINIYEIDLRWGITDDQSTALSQVEICLSEVQRSDIFIGILGGRYGWIPLHFDVDSLPGCERLQGHCEGRSITELEMNLFALTRAADVSGKAFFYIRDQSFVKNIPQEYLSDFCSEDEKSTEKLEDLKERVKKSGLEQYEYPCRWGGVVDGKPIVSNLDSFGNRVMNNIWTSIKTNYLQQVEIADDGSDTSHEAFAERAAENFVGRKSMIKQCFEVISASAKAKCSVLMISGKTGCGKTSFVAKLYKDYASENSSCCCFFADAMASSRSVEDMLRYLFVSLQSYAVKKRAVPDSFRELQNEFSELLKDVGRKAGNQRVLVFMDGLDLIETTGRMSVLGWLPDPLPKGVFFVISCNQSGQCAEALASRRSAFETIQIGPLDMMERTEFVRRLLKKYRKELNESAFQNQMKLLVSKREANLPIFLKFACEEIRFFGLYERLSEHLRKLPQTVPLLLQSIAVRLESDHGKELVSWALLILYLSRQGLSEDELFEVVCCVAFCMQYTTQQLNSDSLIDKDVEADQNISRIEFAMLTRSLKGLVQQSDEQPLQLSFFDVRNLVKQRYVRTAGSENMTRVHRVLAAYYKKRSFNKNWKQSDAKALSEIVYHMAAGGLWSDLHDTLCSLSFIYVKFQAGLGAQLLEDFLANVEDLPRQQEKQRSAFLENRSVKEYQAFVSRNMHILDQFPVLAIQQAINDPQSQKINEDASQCTSRGRVIKWLNKPSRPSPIKRTINFNEAVLSLDVSPNSSTIACGTQDGIVRLFDAATGNDVGNFIGHANSVTSCCFVGLQRLVSASLDCTLSVWDVSGGHRVHHLTGHRRPVTCCTPVPSSQQIVSVSLDCLAILWNIKSGDEVARFKSGTRPYNTVACDLTGRLVALGGWDCLIKVWDILTNKRHAVLKGHESSIRAVAFSPSGSHIVSSALLGDVYVWAVASGTQVGKFSFGALALNSIRYTADGMQMIGACTDSSVKVWSGTLGQACGTFSDSTSEHDWALSVAVDMKGEFVYVGYHSGRVVAFLYQSGEVSKRHHLHKSAVRSICMAKDNSFVVTASDDRTAKIIRVKDSKVFVLEGHKDPLRCVRTSRAQIATGSEDCTIRLWNAMFIEDQSSITVAAVLDRHQGHVTCLDFSPCDTKLMSGSTDKSLIIWDVVRKTPLHEIHNCHRDWVNACAWSDIGDFVVTGSNDFTLKLWDAKTGTTKYEFLGNASAINGVAYKFGCVASTAFDGSLRVWTHKGAEITTIKSHKDRANGICLWKPEDAVVEGWDVEDWENKTTNQLIKSKQPKLEKVDIVTVSDDGTLKKWKPFLPQFIENLNGHTRELANIAVSPDGKDLFSCSYDKTVKCWDQAKFESRDPPHATDVNCVRISENGERAISTGRDGSVAVWDTSSFKVTGTFKASWKSIGSACFMDSDTIAVGDDLGVLAIWHTNGRHVGRVNVDASSASPITALVRSREILGCSTYTACFVFFIDNDKPHKWASGRFDVSESCFPNSWFLDLDITEDAKTVVAAYTHSAIHTFDISLIKKKGQAWKPSVKLQNPQEQNITLFQINCGIDEHILQDAQGTGVNLFGVKFFKYNNEDYVIGGASSGFVEILKRGEDNRIRAFKAHDKAIKSLVITNGLLITASVDTTLKIWDLASMETFEKSLKQVGLFFCRGPVSSLDAKYVDGKYLIFVGDSTGNVEVLHFFK